MYSAERYCAVCGCLFNLPDIRNPANPDPDEDCLLPYADPYDSRLLPREMTEWLTHFRVVGRCPADMDSSLVNQSPAPNFFLSQDATWEYEQSSYGQISVPTVAGTTAEIDVYFEHGRHANSMLFPMHKACLDILQRLCQIRQAQNQGPAADMPITLEAFCDAFQQRRRKNLNEPDKSMGEDFYYAKSGGIEWSHDYYGARQFWADEWNTEPGWEFLCADPSSGKIPSLHSYLVSEPLKMSSTGAAQASSTEQIMDLPSWLFPEEAETIIGEKRFGDWGKDIEMLLQDPKVSSIDDGGEETGEKKLRSAPLGLKNRWRIWKILESISVSD